MTQTKGTKNIKIDLDGCHPTDITETGILARIIQQSWEMGRAKFISFTAMVTTKESRLGLLTPIRGISVSKYVLIFATPLSCGSGSNTQH